MKFTKKDFEEIEDFINSRIIRKSYPMLISLKNHARIFDHYDFDNFLTMKFKDTYIKMRVAVDYDTFIIKTIKECSWLRYFFSFSKLN